MIDLLIDALQSGGVARAEVTPTRHIRDVGEERLVDANGPILVTEAKQTPPHRHRGHSFGADADRVDLDAKRGRGLTGRARIDRTSIVLAVREQNDHLGSSRRRAQPIRRRGERGTDGGAVLELTRGEIVDRRAHNGIVCR